MNEIFIGIIALLVAHACCYDVAAGMVCIVDNAQKDKG
jgi:hypothetical protein